MKLKTTKKQVLQNCNNVISVSYCALQYLLSYEREFAYTCGVNGWNADIYAVNNATIVTGYRPFGKYAASYETCKKYDNQAQEVLYKSGLSENERREILRGLLSQFVAEVLSNE